MISISRTFVIALTLSAVASVAAAQGVPLGTPLPGKPLGKAMNDEPRALAFAANQLTYDRVADARDVTDASLRLLFEERGLPYPAPEIFLRVFKYERELELWVRPDGDQTWTLLKQYPVCALPGQLGPKRQMGDVQVPEGFYFIDQFNPESNYHLSLRVNYPNLADRMRREALALGGDIYIHGGCETIGCVPIEDNNIKEVYWLAVQAMDAGQNVIPVHIFPARLDAKRMKWLASTFDPDPALLEFWQNLAEGYAYFEQTQRVPWVTVAENGRYTIPSHGRLADADSTAVDSAGVAEVARSAGDVVATRDALAAGDAVPAGKEQVSDASADAVAVADSTAPAPSTPSTGSTGPSGAAAADSPAPADTTARESPAPADTTTQESPAPADTAATLPEEPPLPVGLVTADTAETAETDAASTDTVPVNADTMAAAAGSAPVETGAAAGDTMAADSAASDSTRLPGLLGQPADVEVTAKPDSTMPEQPGDSAVARPGPAADSSATPPPADSAAPVLPDSIRPPADSTARPDSAAPAVPVVPALPADSLPAPQDTARAGTDTVPSMPRQTERARRRIGGRAGPSQGN